jgi:hypothetical protein
VRDLGVYPFTPCGADHRVGRHALLGARQARFQGRGTDGPALQAGYHGQTSYQRRGKIDL